MGGSRARDRRLHSHMSFDDDNEDNRDNNWQRQSCGQKDKMKQEN